MQNNKKNKLTAFFKSYGFYISLLAVCTAIASAGYFTSLNESKKQNADSLHKSEEVSVYGETAPTEPPALYDTDVITSASPSVSYPAEDNTEVIETDPRETVTEYSLPSFGEITVAFDDKALVFSEYFDDWRVHDAIDFDGSAAPDVSAAADGTVEKIYTDDKYGLTVIISHADGCTTHYSSLDSAADIAVGDTVSRGDIIGQAGDSCAFEASQGKHLHFQAMRSGKAFNPF